MNRELTRAEMNLIRWMLEHSGPEARALLPQLEKAQVTPWRCPCGCASFNLSIRGLQEPSGGIHPVADFTFGTEDNPSGIIVFERSGMLAMVEVCGIGSDAPKSLPLPESLRPY